MKIIGDFSEDLIKKYLEDKVYEKRGMTREAYIKKCKVAWNKMKYDPDYERKVIIDFTQPVMFHQLMGINEQDIDFTETEITNLPVNGFDKSGKKDIECVIAFSSARHPNEKGELEIVKVKNVFTPPNPEEFEKENLEQGLFLVALFDVLGFSNLMKDKGSKEILSIYQELINNVLLKKNYKAIERVKVAKNQYMMAATYTPIKYAYFSDTIILWTTNKDTHITPFATKCADLICEALKIGIPLRGAISFGEATMNKGENIFLGKAIVEANEIEKTQRWIGASFGAAFYLSEFKENISETLIVPLFCQHLKEDTKYAMPYLTLDWINRWKTKNYPDLKSCLTSLMERAPEKNKSYYQNTIDFINHVEHFKMPDRCVFLRSNPHEISKLHDKKPSQFYLRPIILKSKSNGFHSGYLFDLPEKLIDSIKGLKEFIKKSWLFVDTSDYDKMIEFYNSLRNGTWDLKKLTFVKDFRVDDIEYIHMFFYDRKLYGKGRSLGEKK